MTDRDVAADLLGLADATLRLAGRVKDEYDRVLAADVRRAAQTLQECYGRIEAARKVGA